MHVPNQCYLDANSNCFLEKSPVSKKKSNQSIESKFSIFQIYVYIRQKRSVFVERTYYYATSVARGPECCHDHLAFAEKKKKKEKKKKEKEEAKQVLDEGRNPASRRRLIKGTVELAFRVGAAAKFQIDRVQFGRALSNVVSCIMHGTWRAGWPPEYKSVRAVSFPPSLPALRFTRFVVPGC